MRNRKTFIGIALLIAVLLIGIAYAEITDLSLYVKGSASADPSSENFKVKFTEDISTGGVGTVTADLDDTDSTGKTATISVTGLTAKGQKATATYTIINDSPDLSANLAAEVSKNTNSTYFKVTPTLAANSITATGDTETTTMTVEVELMKTPIDATVSSEIEVTLTASPVQPGA